MLCFCSGTWRIVFPSNVVLVDMITIKKGLELPIAGGPEQVIHNGPAIRHVATLGEEYIGLRPTMKIKVGDKVQKGQVLFEDKKNLGVKYTALASGTILEINAWPERLDLNDQNIRRTKTAGVKMIINTDSHQKEQLRFMEFGVAQARRGWAEKKDIINCWPLGKLLTYFKKQ